MGLVFTGERVSGGSILFEATDQDGKRIIIAATLEDVQEFGREAIQAPATGAENA
ncbi:hypothetical protein MESS4_60128 [Mesorhizobium sp. STM 4661]|nr:hypothetical protein MESS4_60128 [Mesorhizobium sp. STM 4661]